MCGRFNITSDPLAQLLMELVGLTHPGPDNHNAAPTESVSVLRVNARGDPEIVAMRWWLTPYWAKEMSTRYSMFNTKSETVAKSPAFREPVRKRRCVVPVSGFYEWQRVNGQKLPFYITASQFPGLLLAGVWDRWRNPDSGEVLENFAVLTSAAHPAMEFVHNRQPVMLSPADANRWLDAGVPLEDLAAVTAPSLPMQLDVIPVSTHVNNARHKDARCVEPIGESRRISATRLGDE
ncbi:MAG: SOS response-associated peptidase [Pseudomonadales bacterium]|jgi:putative SOS response-associated peptidase YedK|nr:SOS response-associated peptidase [Pseudomonadales bacterium]MDP6471912.1 SOS response-associated peptidase [Pseudomonadales bacterium]MDP6826818.1 SOS response-associated peptidase [Pseudomonadales bacterium]MDP6970904.1 SOS response-associated peptidase [Pseudomonadales bacterium]|tara:strand:- start:164 stop:871 length:708 start_codon:yes stop_codon:yes gene_type:complete